MSQSPQQDRQPPDARAVFGRAVILLEIHRKAAATPPADYLAPVMQNWNDEDKDSFTEKMQALYAKQEEKIRKAGLWDSLTIEEQAFMRTGVLEMTAQQRIDASWLAESICCLLWALGAKEQILPYDSETDTAPLFKRGDQAIGTVEQASLRPAEEINRQRDWAELWHWRCRTRKLLEEKRIPEVLPNGMSMARVIQMTAGKAAEEGIFPAPVGDDFPAFGGPFRELTAEQFARVTSISQERHKALNWLCGYAPGNRWAETPTDT